MKMHKLVNEPFKVYLDIKYKNDYIIYLIIFNYTILYRMATQTMRDLMAIKIQKIYRGYKVRWYHVSYFLSNLSHAASRG